MRSKMVDPESESSDTQKYPVYHFITRTASPDDKKPFCNVRNFIIHKQITFFLSSYSRRLTEAVGLNYKAVVLKSISF